MKLERVVVRELIKTMPQTFVQKLRNDDEFVAFSELPLIRFGELGTFRHDAVLKSLARAKEASGQVELIARNGKHYLLERSQDGVRTTSIDNTGSGRIVKEFSFLDPDREIRLGALGQAVNQCWPSLPSIRQWQSILEERPLSETELAGLISQINETPGNFLTVLESKWRSGGEMDARSFFPTSLEYYKALVASPPEGLGADAWIDNVLVPHLKQRLGQSLNDGLKLALALNVDPRLCPAGLVSSMISDDELIVVLRELAATRSPLALLGIFEIAVSRMAENGQFRELASDVLECLVGNKSRENRCDHAWQILPALITAGLKRMSVEEGIWCQPPFWRRLAAFAHAHFLTEILEVESEDDFAQFIRWMSELKRYGEHSAILLDFKKDPLWRIWDVTSHSLRMHVVRRLGALKDVWTNNGLELKNGHLVDSAFDSIKNGGGLIDIGISTLLYGGMRMSDVEGCDISNSGPEMDFITDAAAALEIEPMGKAWYPLAWATRRLRFDDALLDSLKNLPSRWALGEATEDREAFFGALEKAAEIAATQPSEALANAVADVLTQKAANFSGARDAEAGFVILMMSSGAFVDDLEWRKWIEKRMADYAFSLPKGEACSQLLLNLNSLETLIPIKDRCLGRAKKFVSSGI